MREDIVNEFVKAPSELGDEKRPVALKEEFIEKGKNNLQILES